MNKNPWPALNYTPCFVVVVSGKKYISGLVPMEFLCMTCVITTVSLSTRQMRALCITLTW